MELRVGAVKQVDAIDREEGSQINQGTSTNISNQELFAVINELKSMLSLFFFIFIKSFLLLFIRARFFKVI